MFAAAIHGILLDANDAETCNLLCIQCNASAVFANGHCECNFADDSEKGIIMHLQIYHPCKQIAKTVVQKVISRISRFNSTTPYSLRCRMHTAHRKRHSSYRIEYAFRGSNRGGAKRAFYSKIQASS